MQKYSDIAQTMATRNTGSIASDNTYTVKKNDTLSGIADYFGITLAKLKSANNNITKVTVGSKVKIPTYANGTTSASGGLSWVDDDLLNQTELVIHRPNQGRLTQLEYGDGVLNGGLTSNIMALANNAQSILSNTVSPNLNLVTPNASSGDYSISIPISIQGNADAVAVAQLRKDIPDLLYEAIIKTQSGTSPSIWRQ